GAGRGQGASRVGQRLLVAALDERDLVGVLRERLAEAGHIAVAEDSGCGRNESLTVVVEDGVLAAQELDDGLGHRQSDGRFVAHGFSFVRVCCAVIVRSSTPSLCCRVCAAGPPGPATVLSVTEPQLQGRPWMTMVLDSVISATAARTPSLPIPLAFRPPYGIRSARHSGVPLMWMLPASTSRMYCT